jgi:Ca2+-binding EF-hand superfamily protein
MIIFHSVHLNTFFYSRFFFKFNLATEEWMSYTLIYTLYTGTVDFYELLLAIALTIKGSVEDKLKCLFALCDIQRTGMLSQADIFDTFLMSALLNLRDQVIEPAKMEEIRSQITSHVNKTFGDRTQISQDEFSQLFAEEQYLEDLGRIAYQLLIVLVLQGAYDD